MAGDNYTGGVEIDQQFGKKQSVYICIEICSYMYKNGKRFKIMSFGYA